MAKISDQKLRGGYYTPLPIAKFLVDWAIQSPKDTVLEPSCGDGVFFGPIIDKFKTLNVPSRKIPEQICAVEIERDEFNKAKNKLSQLSLNGNSASFYNDDFFKSYFSEFQSKKFSAVVGNPPFIRYQNFDTESRERAIDIMESLGLKMTKLTNIWVPFLVASSHLLENKGRLAMVIPAELLQVKYAAHLREFLSKFYSYITIITFKKLLFPSILQEIVLFLGEKNNSEHGINIVELDDSECLENYLHKLPGKTQLKPVDHSTEKWTKYFLSKDEILLLRSLRNNPKLTNLGDFAEVDVGIVTGRNEFFVIDERRKSINSFSNHLLNLVGRSTHLKGFIFKNQDWKESLRNNAKGYLINLPNLEFDQLPKNYQEYIKWGEEEEFHKGYKCRIRNPWYTVPSVWVSDAFLLRQIYKYPKIVLNQTGAVCTDTIHRVRLKSTVNKELATLCFLNSLTFAFSEIIGRSYGGGVLELEPNESENLPIPLFSVPKTTLEELDSMIRNGDDIEAILDITDKTLLKERLGLSNQKIMSLRNIWKKLSERRNNRKYAKSKK